MRYIILVLCFYLVSSALHAHGENLHLVLPYKNTLEPNTTEGFYIAALQLALHKTAAADEQIELSFYDREVRRERARLLVSKGVLDVVWSSSNPEREDEFAAVKFNLLRGINEYRVLLIRAEDQARFDQINNLQDLQQLKIGTGTHWSDTAVYRFNNLPLVKSYSYEPMFRMLKLKRFDYMARSLQEIQDEVKRFEKLGLATEQHLVIYYPQPIYFFLNKNDQALAERIKRGLEIAQQDGSLDALFFDIPHFRQAWETMQSLDRKVIQLQVPQ
jgi:hypothetical protein